MSDHIDTGFSLVFSDLELSVVWFPNTVVDNDHDSNVDKSEDCDGEGNQEETILFPVHTVIDLFSDLDTLKQC